jgi:hypothetical protein
VVRLPVVDVVEPVLESTLDELDGCMERESIELHVVKSSIRM